MITVYTRLLAGRVELGGYTKYVFQDINTGKYILCTKFPNWDTPPIKLGSVGNLKYKEILAGKGSWYEPISKIYIPYKFNYNQFIDFDEKKTIVSTIIL